MSRDLVEVKVSKLPPCDFGASHPLASYDGKTKMGPWANMCGSCFSVHGIGLGMGRGQKLKFQP